MLHSLEDLSKAFATVHDKVWLNKSLFMHSGRVHAVTAKSSSQMFNTVSH